MHRAILPLHLLGLTVVLEKRTPVVSGGSVIQPECGILYIGVLRAILTFHQIIRNGAEISISLFSSKSNNHNFKLECPVANFAVVFISLNEMGLCVLSLNY